MYNIICSHLKSKHDVEEKIKRELFIILLTIGTYVCYRV